MDKISKKEIRKIIADLIENALSKVKLSTPTDKTKRDLVKLSRKFSGVIHDEMKKQAKQKIKALKAVVDENKLVKGKKTKTKGKKGDVL